MKTPILSIIEGLPGSGKTSKMLNEMISDPGRYILAAPRKDLVEEHVRSLKNRAIRAGVRPTIVAVHSDQGTRGQVRRRISDAIGCLANERHAIVAITHEGLQSSDPSLFDGWDARIDEVPDAVASGQLVVPVVARLLETLYDLIKVEGKWAKVTPKPGAPTIRNFMMDDLAKRELVRFHKRVTSPAGLLVDLGNWSDAIGSSKPIRWWSLWSPRDLAGCASIKIAAAGYDSSLCNLATSSFYPGGLVCETERVEATRLGSPQVRVHYFTNAHSGSITFWDNDQGRACLMKVGQYLGQIRGLGFWSGNETVRDRLEIVLHHAQKVLPRQAGTNGLRELTSCAIIYSNKPQDSDRAILEAFGLTKDQIARAREIEDVQQFVMRGAIRNPDYAGTYDVYLYDLRQAEAVRDYLKRGGLTNVTLVGIEAAGIMDVERPKSGRKPQQLNERSREERVAERRAKDAARKRSSRAAERARQGVALRKAGRPVGSVKSSIASATVAHTVV